MIPVQPWLPMPLLSVLLLAVWLMLQQSVALGQLLLGTLLAIVIPLVTRHFWEPQPTIKRPWLLVRYVLRVLGDIIVANLEVSKLILDPRGRMKPAFIEYPLELEELFPITILASTITLTPGTVSANLRQDRRTLLIHALNTDDIPATIDTIRERYERPLKEIFGC
ncbi:MULTISPECIES: Na+/H+ antiporter subunit E [unclassified Modicisalibacter]|uniref:Na+/H+ antiporter subunit E n=1 Tax=unclassified Modicisalibacter TaxID=2679913 RepID=UPI001CCF6570|nr:MULTISPECIES: Na+/H+ antiporter subunit E [unclassified Modicisalibacter]MBZ9559313.1 Na+/H+ antiporter subunit E [Modicisalibacter sp. R2A 31.J]MBZ9576522.1 Na+/H+ antiporter subunit E [Modicisalibacter sp. MOD 31.J]